MANPKHVAELRQGVRHWNTWIAERRKESSGFVADLSGVDFGGSDWDSTSFRIEIRGKKTVGLTYEPDPMDKPGYQVGIDLNNANLIGIKAPNANFSTATLKRARLTGAWLPGSNFNNTKLAHVRLDYVDLNNADLFAANLEHAYIFSTNLSSADMRACNLSNTYMLHSNITGTAFQGANFSGANVAYIKYDLRKMRGKYRGIGGVETTMGHAIWRRHAQDQDYIDSKIGVWTDQITQRTGTYVPSKFSWCAAFAALLVTSPPWKFHVPGLLLGLWSLLDFGRSVWRVALFGAGVVAAFAWWLDGPGSAHVSISPTIATLPNRSIYASIGVFTTLGIPTAVIPLDYVGQVAIIVEMLLGFTTLGLLIAVLQNRFARRS